MLNGLPSLPSLHAVVGTGRFSARQARLDVYDFEGVCNFEGVYDFQIDAPNVRVLMANGKDDGV